MERPLELSEIRGLGAMMRETGHFSPSDTETAAALTAKARNALPSSAFAIPESRDYPIHNIDHARDALARASGKPEESRVKAAVRRRYPQLKSSDNDSDDK